MAVNPGTTLMNGRYRIIKLLGRGGFGFVHLAQDTLMNEEVAIKELIPALIDDETVLKRFIAEAKAAMRLRHPNVVATHNVFADGENYYLVMEYMRGGSLEDLLRRQGKLKAARALRIMADVCEGLAHAHRTGVIHCDIKPANVLFAADGMAKLTDFGIAYISPKLVSRSWRTARDFAAGTLLYMAPEQVDGVRDDPRVDIYALGAMLYQMLTGRPYLDFDLRETPGAQADNVNRIRRQRPVPLRTVNPAIPKGLEGVVLKALAKEPGSRYQSVAQMVKALEGIGEKRDREPQTTALESTRSSRLVPVIGGVVIAAAFLMAVYWVLALRAPTIPAGIPLSSLTAIGMVTTHTPAPSIPTATPAVTRSVSAPTATVAVPMEATTTTTPTSSSTSTPTPTDTPMPTSTPPTPPCEELIHNGSFETAGDWINWIRSDTPRLADYSTDAVRSGDWAMRLGITDQPDAHSYSSVRQTVTIPEDAVSARLSFWYYPICQDAYPYDWQEAIIYDATFTHKLDWPMRQDCSDSQTWMHQAFDLMPYKGQTIIVYFNVFNNGVGNLKTAMYLDDVSIEVCR